MSQDAPIDVLSFFNNNAQALGLWIIVSFAFFVVAILSIKSFIKVLKWF